ncbi:MAG: efflux RND transporter permease subunit [Endomicrobiales bacterium]
MNLARIAIKRPTFITAIIAVMVIVGTIFMQRLPVDMFPDVNFPFVAVTTVYPGAGPREMETLVSKILEEQISSISGLKNVYSINQDGFSMVWGEFSLETDSKYAEQQVKDKIAQVRNRLPAEIKEPIIRRFDPADQPVMMLSVTGRLSPTQLYDLADTTIKTGLEQVPNVASVEIVGGTRREIHVDLDLRKLKEYEVSLSRVAGSVGANSQNIPIGKVARGSRELSFRSIGEYQSVKKIQDAVVSFFGSDVPVTVSRLGEVKDSSEEVKTKGYLNGTPALVMNVFKQSNSNTVAVSDNLLKRIDKLNAALKGLKGAPQIVMVMDSGKPIRMNITDVRTTIFEGILLAILVVYLFLGNVRSTFITVVALPNSLIGAFIFMGLAGFSVNMLTLMALSLCVGLLIDDAIVVRENIFRRIENGEEPMVAAKKGTDEVALAVVATTLTVIAVFLPVGFLQGMVGQFFKQFGLTVVFAMCISLFDALTTAPMLSAYLIGKVNGHREDTGISALVHLPAVWFGKFYGLVERVYEKTIRFTLGHKVLVLGSAFLIFIGSLALVKGIPTTFMPTNEWGEFVVNLEADPSVSLDQMDKDTLIVESLLRREKDIEMVLATVGNANGESNVASLSIQMVPEKMRTRTTTDMKEYARELLKPYDDTLHPTVADRTMGGGSEYPFSLILSGDNLDDLSKEAAVLVEKFKVLPGLKDVGMNYKPGKPEFQVKMNPARMEQLGVQSIAAGMELRGMVEGLIPAKFRENDLEYDIRVKLRDDQRDLSRTLDSLYVPNVNGQLVKLRNIADTEQTAGPSKIFRKNKTRYIEVHGNLGKNGAIGQITAEAKKILAAEIMPAGISYDFAGASEDMMDLFRNMLIAAGLSIIFIYLVLASLYESVIVPFTIMLALPLAIVGGLIALFLTGQSINMFTMIGFIMLLGLVTKNSILLVDYTQRLIRQGLSHDEAIVKAGLTRLRPILMTTFALIAGMLPLALGLTEVGRFRQSMGIAIIGGLVSSTALTLVVIPAVFGNMDRLRVWVRKLARRPEMREIDKINPEAELSE